MEKKVKLLMIIITIIIVIIIGILIYLLNTQNGNNSISIGKEEIYYSDQDTHFRNEVEKVTSKYDFFDTEVCIKKYITSLQKLDKNLYERESSSVNDTINIYKEELYNLLDTDYIKQNKLTIQNIDKKLSNYYTNLNFQIRSMYVLDAEEELAIYFVYGNLISTNNNKIENYGFIVKRDTQNLKFSIIPYDYMIDNGYEETLLESKNLDSIKKYSINENDNNYYTSNAYDDGYISNYYFNMYKENLQFNVENIYNSMEKEYREKRFGTLQNYKEYVTKNYKELLKCNLNQYVTETEDNFTNYICKDQLGNYYIFKETNIGEYTLTLDTYTLKQDKFNEKYKTATNNEKVGMNISEFFQMINAKDYKSAYSVLSSSFKEKNFKNQDSFEQYIRTKLYLYNDINLVNFSDKISGVFTYYIEVSNKENKNDAKIKMNIIMQLLEDTEYQLSFEIID